MSGYDNDKAPNDKANEKALDYMISNEAADRIVHKREDSLTESLEFTPQNALRHGAVISASKAVANEKDFSQLIQDNLRHMRLDLHALNEHHEDSQDIIKEKYDHWRKEMKKKEKDILHILAKHNQEYNIVISKLMEDNYHNLRDIGSNLDALNESHEESQGIIKKKFHYLRKEMTKKEKNILHILSNHNQECNAVILKDISRMKVLAQSDRILSSKATGPNMLAKNDEYKKGDFIYKSGDEAEELMSDDSCKLNMMNW